MKEGTLAKLGKVNQIQSYPESAKNELKALRPNLITDVKDTVEKWFGLVNECITVSSQYYSIDYTTMTNKINEMKDASEPQHVIELTQDVLGIITKASVLKR